MTEKKLKSCSSDPNIFNHCAMKLYVQVQYLKYKYFMFKLKVSSFASLSDFRSVKDLQMQNSFISIKNL